MRVSIVGLGSIGRRRAANLKAMGHELLTYDLNSATAIIKHGDDTYESYHMARDLKDFWSWSPDAVLICTPPDSHIGLLQEAFNHQCPAFVEKPLSNNTVVFAQLYDYRWVNMVACNWRFHAGPVAVKDWLNQKAIGQPISARLWHGSYLPDWVPSRDYKTSYVARTGVILDVGSHLVDLAQWLLGPANLRASLWKPARSIGLECDGTAELLLEHESGAITSVGMSFEQRGYEMSVDIMGSKGTLSWDVGTGVSIWLHKDGSFNSQVTGEDANHAMHTDELRHFLDCCEKGIPTCNPISEASKTLAILLEAKK